MRALLVLAALLLAGCAAPPGPCEGTFQDTVTRVVDGDTLDGQRCGRVRLALVDTPERGEDGFLAATAFTRDFCPTGQPAVIDQDAGQPRDVYGRLVAEVHCGGRSLNAALVEAGHARVLTQFCGRSEFAGRAWARCDV